MEVPRGRVTGEFSRGRVPNEEEKVEKELGKGSTTSFEERVWDTRWAGAFVFGESSDVFCEFDK